MCAVAGISVFVAGIVLLNTAASGDLDIRDAIWLMLLAAVATSWLGGNGVMLWAGRLRIFAITTTSPCDGVAVTVRRRLHWWAIADTSFPVYRVRFTSEGIWLIPISPVLRSFFPTFHFPRCRISEYKTVRRGYFGATALRLSLFGGVVLELRSIRSPLGSSLETQMANGFGYPSLEHSSGRD